MLDAKELFSKIKIKPAAIDKSKQYLENHLKNAVDFNKFDIKGLEPMFHQNSFDSETKFRNDVPQNMDKKYVMQNAINNDGDFVVIEGGLKDE